MYSNNQLVGQRIANGAIPAFAIVCEDTANDGKATAATANRGRIIGIGPNYAVSDGETFQFTYGGVAQLKLGGNVTDGDYLKSDSTSRGVTIATGGTTPQHVVGLAVRGGAANDIVPVQVQIKDAAPGDDYLS